MKRCAALAIVRAIKELRRAEKNAGSVWAQALQMQVLGLADILVFTQNTDLLDERTFQEVKTEFERRKAKDLYKDPEPII
jgi:hypothetical protein